MSVQIPDFPSAEEGALEHKLRLFSEQKLRMLEEGAARRLRLLSHPLYLEEQENRTAMAAEGLIHRARDLAEGTGTSLEAALVALCTVETSKWWDIMQDTLRMLREAKSDADVQD